MGVEVGVGVNDASALPVGVGEYNMAGAFDVCVGVSVKVGKGVNEG